ncbi:hypothetical protein [Staphylococcus phage vB_SauH_DELF3]|nr:hypothetical protein [Staphylococcus phage vB_SauH_DELF3]
MSAGISQLRIQGPKSKNGVRHVWDVAVITQDDNIERKARAIAFRYPSFAAEGNKSVALTHEAVFCRLKANTEDLYEVSGTPRDKIPKDSPNAVITACMDKGLHNNESEEKKNTTPRPEVKGNYDGRRFCCN